MLFLHRLYFNIFSVEFLTFKQLSSILRTKPVPETLHELQLWLVFNIILFDFCPFPQVSQQIKYPFALFLLFTSKKNFKIS